MPTVDASLPRSSRWESLRRKVERHQLWLYITTIGVAGALAFWLPQGARWLDAAVSPALACLLFATFAGLPLTKVVSLRGKGRFLCTLLILNGIIAPAVAFGLSRLVGGDPVLVFGVLLVLLVPCIDYVVTFTRMAGGNSAALLTATPLLFVAQVVMLPVYLWFFVGADAAQLTITPTLVSAFVWVVLIPMLLALVLQLVSAQPTGRTVASPTDGSPDDPASRSWPQTTVASADDGRGNSVDDIPAYASVGHGSSSSNGTRITPWPRRASRALLNWAESAMVPVMMLNLALIAYVQTSILQGQLIRVFPVLALFAVFAAVMFGAGIATTKLIRLDVADSRAATFSGITRNSLVILPVALALPEPYGLVPAIVVSQTLVELLVMLLCVLVVPLAIRSRGNQADSGIVRERVAAIRG